MEWLSIVGAVLAVIAAVAYKHLKPYLTALVGKIEDERIRALAEDAVRNVEKIAKDKALKGAQKLEEAKHALIAELKDKGVPVDESKVDATIHAALSRVEDAAVAAITGKNQLNG